MILPINWNFYKNKNVVVMTLDGQAYEGYVKEVLPKTIVFLDDDLVEFSLIKDAIDSCTLENRPTQNELLEQFDEIAVKRGFLFVKMRFLEADAHNLERKMEVLWSQMNEETRSKL